MKKKKKIAQSDILNNKLILLYCDTFAHIKTISEAIIMNHCPLHLIETEFKCTPKYYKKEVLAVKK